ncbi:hypothetical protein [Spirosoma pollinicola]|uniref:Uncharacterized protein n=1 Tax=Spirosoma pollinicola TaxID=2057025 RepID=A0A2K8Z2E1_9BACT|nr:hypothetical protein [Spirosoma pollinicola]AUD04043.1 hypothetical protein CWM47_20745 [Spirosoma pollinicola]
MGKNIITKTCYMCNSLATSTEHVPPRCLFPEEKDFKGVNLRKNLLTVPSCDLHNIEKSQDDQFLMATLAGVVGNNIVGYIHTNTKVKRALDRKKDLVNSTIFNAKKITGKTIEGLKFPLLKGSPDINRLTKCFEYIAYGLYFIEYKKRFEGECSVFISFVRYKNPNLEKTKILKKKHLIRIIL